MIEVTRINDTVVVLDHDGNRLRITGNRKSDVDFIVTLAEKHNVAHQELGLSAGMWLPTGDMQRAVSAVSISNGRWRVEGRPDELDRLMSEQSLYRFPKTFQVYNTQGAPYMNIEYIHSQRLKIDDGQGNVLELEADVNLLQDIVREVQGRGIFTLPKYSDLKRRDDYVCLDAGKLCIEASNPSELDRIVREGKQYRLPHSIESRHQQPTGGGQAFNAYGETPLGLPGPLILNTEPERRSFGVANADGETPLGLPEPTVANMKLETPTEQVHNTGPETAMGLPEPTFVSTEPIRQRLGAANADGETPLGLPHTY